MFSSIFQCRLLFFLNTALQETASIFFIISYSHLFSSFFYFGRKHWNASDIIQSSEI